MRREVSRAEAIQSAWLAMEDEEFDAMRIALTEQFRRADALEYVLLRASTLLNVYLIAEDKVS